MRKNNELLKRFEEFFSEKCSLQDKTSLMREFMKSHEVSEDTCKEWFNNNSIPSNNYIVLYLKFMWSKSQDYVAAYYLALKLGLMSGNGYIYPTIERNIATITGFDLESFKEYVETVKMKYFEDFSDGDHSNAMNRAIVKSHDISSYFNKFEYNHPRLYGVLKKIGKISDKIDVLLLPLCIILLLGYTFMLGSLSVFVSWYKALFVTSPALISILSMLFFGCDLKNINSIFKS